MTSTGEVDSINGGATRGANLFHSFGEFNVDEGRAAVFTNPSGIENILTRVTGVNPSNILGTLGVAGGNANLFLINPNGIIFGPNARLDVGGSFVGTTANALGFGNQGFFSATNRSNPELLTVNPSALLFNQMRAASIENSSVADSGLNLSSDFIATGLRVPDGKSLLLVGGDINMSGGLYAFGGRVELGGLASAGTVGLNGNGNNLSLSFPNSVERSDVSLSNGAGVDVTAGDGGSIAVNARNLEMTGGSFLFAGIESGLGSDNSKAGNIDINATGAINLNNQSFIANQILAEANGQGGDVSISASTLNIEGEAQVITSLFGSGKGGEINITAGSLSVTNGAELNSSTFGRGDAGNVTVTTSGTVFLDGVGNNGGHTHVFSNVGSTGEGKGGEIIITAGSLSVTNGAELSSNTLGRGDAGSVKITAQDHVSFDGLGSVEGGYYVSSAFSNVGSTGEGKGGEISITAGSLSVTNGARLNVATSSQGNAGSVNINARDTVIFDGVGTNGLPSAALSNVEAEAVGNGGEINIETGSVLVKNGSLLESRTRGEGNAGSVNINARDTVIFDGVGTNGWVSGTYSSVENRAVGNGGDINLTTGSLSLTNGAGLTASSEGNGAAGNIEVNASSIRLDNQAFLISDTVAGQGNIFLRSQDLVLRRGSNITTNATGTATGGNITIDTDIIAVSENSDISANAQNAFGGRVIIDAQGIFGTEFREIENPATSDITATSELGSEFSGTVEINTPDVNPSSGLVNLPAQPTTDIEVAQACTQSGSQAQSEFVITGRGGLPPNPDDALSTDAVMVDLVTLNPSVAQPSASVVSPHPTSPTPARIVEAQGWVVDTNGKVILTANTPTVTPQSDWQKTANCQQLED